MYISTVYAALNQTGGNLVFCNDFRREIEGAGQQLALSHRCKDPKRNCHMLKQRISAT